MEVKVESLGKVCVTVDKDYWSSEKSYDKLVIVEVAGVGTFISRKPVPARTNINDRIYWIPITVQGGDGGTIPISQDFGDSETITVSQKTLTEKVNSLQDKGGYVRFDQDQSESLTEEQKEIARHNIGAEDTITVDSELSDNSENPVQNKVVKAAIDNIQGGADKEYNPAEFSGLGKVYLKKNIVEVGGVEKNILTQSAFYKEGTQTPNTDTVFVIQYDFDLNGQTINVPAGCALEFDGGSIGNSANTGDFVGNNTTIVAELVKIFSNIGENGNIKLSGTWNVDVAHPEWFGADTATYTDVPQNGEKVTIVGEDWSAAFEKCFVISSIVHAVPKKTYWIYNTITVPNFSAIVTPGGPEYAACIKMPRSAANNPNLVMFDVAGHGFTSKNVRYEGCFWVSDILEASSPFPHDSNPDGFRFAIDYEGARGDIDAMFENCIFTRFKNGITAYGRNIELTDCKFEGVTMRCLEIHHQKELLPDSDDEDTRGFILKGCRFHSCSRRRQYGVYTDDAVCVLSANRMADATLIDNCYFDADTGCVYRGSKKVAITNCNMRNAFGRRIIELLEDTNDAGTAEDGFPWISRIQNNYIKGMDRGSHEAIFVHGAFQGVITCNVFEGFMHQAIRGVSGINTAYWAQCVISNNKFLNICNACNYRYNYDEFIRMIEDHETDMTVEELDYKVENSKHCVRIEGSFVQSVFSDNVIRSSGQYSPFIAALYADTGISEAILTDNHIDDFVGEYPYDTAGTQRHAAVSGTFVNGRNCQKGTSQQRPKVKAEGYTYFDTTLNKVLTWSGIPEFGDNGWIDNTFNIYSQQENEELVQTLQFTFNSFGDHRYNFRTTDDDNLQHINNDMDLTKRYRVAFSPDHFSVLNSLCSYIIGRDDSGEGAYGAAFADNGREVNLRAIENEAIGVNLQIRSGYYEEEDVEITAALINKTLEVKIFRIVEVDSSRLPNSLLVKFGNKDDGFPNFNVVCPTGQSRIKTKTGVFDVVTKQNISSEQTYITTEETDYSSAIMEYAITPHEDNTIVELANVQDIIEIGYNAASASPLGKQVVLNPNDLNNSSIKTVWGSVTENRIAFDAGTWNLGTVNNIANSNSICVVPKNKNINTKVVVPGSVAFGSSLSQFVVKATESGTEDRMFVEMKLSSFYGATGLGKLFAPLSSLVTGNVNTLCDRLHTNGKHSGNLILELCGTKCTFNGEELTTDWGNDNGWTITITFTDEGWN